MKLKVGMILPGSNIVASMGKDFKKGFEFALKGTILADTDIQPAFVNQGSLDDVQKASEKLTLFEEIDCMTGIISSRVSFPLMDFFKNKNIPVMLSNLGENIFINNTYPDYCFLNSSHLWKSQWALGYWAQKKYKGKISLCMTVYDAGYHMHEAFRLGSVAAGGEVAHLNVLKIQPGIVDTQSLIEHIAEQKPNHVHAVISGKDAKDFWERYRAAGFLEKIPLTVSPFFLDTFDYDGKYDLKTNVFTAACWPDDDELKDSIFAKNYLTEHETYPNIFSILGYENGLFLVEAAKKAKRKNELIDILKHTNIKGPRGEISSDFNTTANKSKVWLKKYEVRRNKSIVKSTIQSLRGPEFESSEIQGVAIKSVSGWQNPYLCI